jgi:succinyl-CoA synthetase beta subunit
MRCDVLATGIVEAVGRVGLEVPLVVRLEGTKVEEGKKIIEESGLKVTNADSLLDGANKILELTS